MIRVLIIDDSPTAREILSQILGSDPQIEIIGAAINGREGVLLTKQLRPDVITMDILMPDMDGYQATNLIMADAPTPIVVVSANTMADETTTAMLALREGALTVLPKPPGPGQPDFEDHAEELIETVKAMSAVKVVRRRPQLRPDRTRAVSAAIRRIRCVAMAASTGGPPALSALLGELPKGFPVPILLVQHIAAGFDSGFANWLDNSTELSVKIASHGEVLEAGSVYMSPQDRHLGVSKDGQRVLLSDLPPIGGFRPAATHLFQSSGEAYTNTVLGVILTGMGRDGVDGLRTIQMLGGTVIAQDEKSSVVFGMPGETVSEGLADFVLPIDAIADHICKLV